MEVQLKKLQEQIGVLEAAIERKENEMSSMLEIGKVLSSELNRDRLIALIMNEVTRLIDAERGTLYVVDQEKGELWSKIALKAEIKEIHLKIGVGIAGTVAGTGEIVNIPDAYKDSRFDPTTDKKTGYHTRSILCMAIREPMREEGVEGQIIGVLQVLNKRNGVFTHSDEEMLQLLGSQIAISLVNSRLYGILEERLNELKLLFNVEKALSGNDEPDTILKNLVTLTCEVIHSANGLVIYRDGQTGEYSRQALFGFSREQIEPAANQAVEFVDMLFTGEEARVLDQSGLKTASEWLDIKLENGMAVSLPGGENQQGVILLGNKKGNHAYYSGNDLQLLASLAGQIARGMENLRLREEKTKADRLATIGNMMSTIVHDLRTPMNNIYGFVDLLKEEEDADVRSEFADIIIEQIKILTNMTTDVLDFAKGKTTMLPRKYPVDKLVKDFVRYFENDIKRKGYHFEYSINAPVMIYVDTEKVIRVFMNIMKNALEAMEPGGTFTMTAEMNNKDVVFRLKDTGHGIPEEIRHRLFDSFVTSGKEGGTGLGLAIVKKVIDAHKGRIEVESEQGKGTTFNIYFPKL
jgi:signal transduction histidine kinase/putative methionine-R-sulfoxide reductase with GAF domain